jgi:hypothetical protein
VLEYRTQFLNQFYAPEDVGTGLELEKALPLDYKQGGLRVWKEHWLTDNLMGDSIYGSGDFDG